MTRLLLVVAAALRNDSDDILIAQRPAHKSLGGLWEFPGGKIEPNERPEAALARELHEELAIEIDPAEFQPLAFASHAYEDFHLLMPLYEARRWRGTPRPIEAQALAWVAPRDLANYPMPPADIPLIAQLLQRAR